MLNHSALPGSHYSFGLRDALARGPLKAALPVCWMYVGPEVPNVAVFAQTTCLLFVITQWKQGTLDEAFVNIYWKFPLFLSFVKIVWLALSEKEDIVVIEIVGQMFTLKS